MLIKIVPPLKIKYRVMISYIVVLLLSLIITFISFNAISERYLEKEVSNLAMQTLGALDRNIYFIFENVKQFSNLIFFDSNIQADLTKINSKEISPEINQSIKKSLVNMLLSGDYISSVFIFDNYDNYYNSFKVGPMFVNGELKNKDWYTRVNELNGDILFSANSGGLIKYANATDKRFISLIRNILDTDYYRKLGTLIINVDEEKIQSYFDEVGVKYNSHFSIVDGNGDYIIRPSGLSDEISGLIKASIGRDDTLSSGQMLKYQNKKHILVQKKLPYEDWVIVGLMPVNKENVSENTYISLFFIIAIMNTLFVIIGSIYLTKIIFKPIENLLAYMKKVRKGEFIQIPVDEAKRDEITEFKLGFNKMVSAIDKLIEDINIEQKTIRKNELDLIQAQINPHFLYNTLDAVSALALIGDNENCLKITQALGDFYRNSLNSAMELTTVRDEIDCIKSYVTILNIRYADKIILHCDIEESILNLKILKLILQPIIENAIYHGIRNKHGQGNIKIEGYLDEDEIIFIITDDGLGISEERIAEVMGGIKENKKRKFGLFSSIQRISLYYNIEKPITIVSEQGAGTEITIRTKVLKDEGADY